MKTEHKTITVKGNEIHYYVGGEKERPAILFLHPAFSDHTCFYKQVDFFANRFRVITIDLIGHGLSKPNNSKLKIEGSIECVLETMKAENIYSIHIAGVSLGSLIAQYFALLHPEKTISLTALGGYNINHIDKRVAQLQQKELFKWLFRIVFSMDAFRRYLASVSAVNGAEQEQFYESVKGFSRKSFPLMSGLSKLIAERKNPRRDYPLLILAGEKDNDLAKKMAECWHNEEPDSMFHIIENAGHCANMDNSERFNNIVLDAIDNSRAISV